MDYICASRITKTSGLSRISHVCTMNFFIWNYPHWKWRKIANYYKLKRSIQFRKNHYYTVACWGSALFSEKITNGNISAIGHGGGSISGQKLRETYQLPDIVPRQNNEFLMAKWLK